MATVGVTIYGKPGMTCYLQLYTQTKAADTLCCGGGGGAYALTSSGGTQRLYVPNLVSLFEAWITRGPTLPAAHMHRCKHA